MKYSIIIVLFLIIPFTLLKSQINQDWVARYSSSVNRGAGSSSVAIDKNGNVYVGGTCDNTADSTGYDIVIVKYSSTGVILWTAKYAGRFNESLYKMVIDTSGNVYAFGEISQTSVNNYADYLTIKYNTSGIQQWASIYSGETQYNDLPVDMAIDPAGNVYVTGRSAPASNPDYDDYVTVKYNTNGVQQWVARYNGTGNLYDYPSSIAVDAAGNSYVTGYSKGVTISNECATVKYNSSGVQQWAARYSAFAQGSCVSTDAAGNVFVAGFTGTSNHDFLTIKYNSAGVQRWAKTYDGVGNQNGHTDEAYAIAVDPAGNVIVTGKSYGGTTKYDFATVKYDSAGVQQWVSRYDEAGTLDEVPSCITTDSSGNIYVAGHCSNNIAGTDRDFATLKYNTAGVQQWRMRYDGPVHKNDVVNGLAVDNHGNVFVTGSSVGLTGTYSEYTTIKYSQLVTGINIISNSVPSNFSLLQNYPNPFNPSTNIEFALPEKSFVKLKVFDFLGREVAELVNENLSAGTYRYNFNGINLSSGMYFYKLETNKFSEAKKMMLVK